MRALRSPILLAVYAAVAGAMAASYFLHYPIPGLFGRAWELLLAGLLLFLSAGTGRALLRWTGTDRRTGLGEEGRTLELFFWSAGIGLVPLTLGLLLVGTLGFFNGSGIIFWTVVWAGVGSKEWRGWLNPRHFSTRPLSEGLGLGWGIRALAAGALLAGFLAALAPPTYYDSLVYHLALPLRYLQEGRIGFVPYNQYAHFPQNMELIFGWFLAAGSDVSTHLFNLLLAALTGGMVWAMGRRNEGRRWDLLLYVTAPCVLLLSTESYVEMPMAFFTTLAVWGADRGLRDRNRAWFVLAGLAGGFSAGIKYTGVLTPAVLTALVALWPGRRSVRDRLLDGVCLGGAAFALFVPWMVKNYVFTGGNPVFPFLPSIFPARNVYMFAESSRAYFSVLAEYSGTSSLLIDLLKMPFRLATDAQSFGGGFDVTGDLGWALPILLLPLSLLAVRKERGFLLAYAAAHIVIWASLRPVLRFLFPIFPLVCLLAGEGVGLAWKEIPAWARRTAALVGGLFLISNGILFYIVEDVRGPLPVALGLVSRDEYLSRKLDYYPAMSFMEKELPPDANVLFVGDQRSYYCPRRHLAPMALLPTPLRDWTEESADGPAFGRKLRALGFTHLFFNRREAKRLESYRVLDLTEHGRAVFESLLRSLVPLYASEGAALYALPL
ncbi:MAG: glycosyltransferase family 39 protein [Elusimicrobia bacterium]|nr:glycosyltransferase family 39 protein [Elusimicrobiota bacterium]